MTVSLQPLLGISILNLSLLVSACGNLASPASGTSGPTCDLPATTPVCDGPVVSGWTSPSGSGSNQLTVSVSSTSVCSHNVNLPCTSVTVCVPGTSNCQTISDILVDTGSFGLRIFSQAIPQNLCSSLPVLTDSQGRSVAECAQFGSGSDWGPVATADVQLGGESVVRTSIQIIHRTFGTEPSACSCADNGPSDAGINGILGVGLFQADCGSACATNANIGYYYGCDGSNCSGTRVAVTNQVRNPVALLGTDNNGVILSLPSVSSSGSSGINGTLTLGIDTQANNHSTGYTKYATDSSGTFTTTFQSGNYSQSFIDSGSNALILPNPGLTICSSSIASGFFCPDSTQAYSASNAGYGGAGSGTVNFTIGNSDALVSTGNSAFNNLGAPATGDFSNTFDWGLPFFFNRTVFVGISGKSSNLGSGPYWAY